MQVIEKEKRRLEKKLKGRELQYQAPWEDNWSRETTQFYKDCNDYATLCCILEVYFRFPEKKDWMKNFQAKTNEEVRKEREIDFKTEEFKKTLMAENKK